jgi:transcriptional regulator with XRE-family HTH domain
MENMKLAEKLRSLIGSGSQAMMARQLGIAPTTLSNYLNAEGEPVASNAIRIANKFGVDAGWLYDESKDVGDRSDPGVSLTDKQLCAEVIRRAMDRIERLEVIVLHAEQFDWKGFSAEIQDGGKWAEGKTSGATETDPLQLSDTKLGVAIATARAFNALLSSATFKLVTMWWGETRPKAVTVRISTMIEGLKSKWAGRMAFQESLAGYDPNKAGLDLTDFVAHLENLVNLLNKFQRSED